MKKLSLMVSLLGIEVEKEERTLVGKTPQDVTRTIIQIMVKEYGLLHRGLDYTDQRIWGKIEDAFDQAVINSSQELVLEDAWFDFLVKCMEKGKLLGSRIANRVFDLIEAAKLEGVKQPAK